MILFKIFFTYTKHVQQITEMQKIGMLQEKRDYKQKKGEIKPKFWQIRLYIQYKMIQSLRLVH